MVTLVDPGKMNRSQLGWFRFLIEIGIYFVWFNECKAIP
jgi:hypothetical protein